MTREKIIQGLYKGDSRAIKEAIKALEKESAEIHEGDVRANIEGDYYMIIEVQKENSKIMHLDGSFEWLDNYNIMTDEKNRNYNGRVSCDCDERQVRGFHERGVLYHAR